MEWLISQQGDDGAWVGFNGASDPGVTIDAVIALAAARNEGIEVDLTKAVAYLEANGKVYARTGTGQAAKLALAAAATGQDPTTFAGLDSIGQALKGYNPNTDMYGTGLYDTALVMLALGTVGKEPPGVVLKSIDGKQMGDGSWSFDGTTGAGNGDTNTTAMLIQALVAVKHTEGDLILHGIEYLQRIAAGAGVRLPARSGRDARRELDLARGAGPVRRRRGPDRASVAERLWVGARIPDAERLLQLSTRPEGGQPLRDGPGIARAGQVAVPGATGGDADGIDP